MWLMVSIFFFSSRRRHTRYIGDWSSDVCSSDLKSSKEDSDSRANYRSHFLSSVPGGKHCCQILHGALADRAFAFRCIHVHNQQRISPETAREISAPAPDPR